MDAVKCRMTHENSQFQSDSTPQDVTARRTTAADSIKSFIAGGFGGVCAVLVGALLERCLTYTYAYAPPFV
jgi:hypothetical protein